MSMTVTMLCGMQSPAAMAADSLVAASSAEEHEVITVGFLVCSDQERRLEQAILAASNPDSPRYGECLTLKQPDSYRPRRSWVNKVVGYLEKAGYTPRIEKSGHRVKTHTTVA